MATVSENLQTALEAVAAELAAGPIKPSYSVGGQSVSWNEYRKSLLDQMALLREQLQAEGPIEVVTQGLLGGSNR